MFDIILIANRGEIACRLIRAVQAAGARAAAVFSEADRGSPHVGLADAALCIGPAAPAESYLNAARILGAAEACGAQAIHPGYGFLSEQAAFAGDCERAGLVFIGPAPEALRVAGDKLASRAAAEAAGVPVIPGAAPGAGAPGTWERAAAALGYPVLVKAAAGGGGRGMRRAGRAEEMPEACRAAAAEAALAFGDGRIYLEKCLDAPRHIEVQLLGDGKGGVLHLGERECSLQRRHQKVIEESPASGLAPGVRARLLDAACALFSKLKYRGAGTAEFLLDGAENFYFLEINARLQVEHPVSEMVTGLDLAQLQLQIAAEGVLPLAQADVRFEGHAAEVRLYAEDPGRDFLPQSGRVGRWLPPSGGGVRVDAGVAAGCDVPPEYDPLLAKIICHGADRAAALGRLSGALAALKVTGIRTNQDFLAAVLEHPAFRAGEIATDFIARHPEVRNAPFPEALLLPAKLAAALALYLEGAGRSRRAGPDGEEEMGPDPWDAPGRWLPGGMR